MQQVLFRCSHEMSFYLHGDGPPEGHTDTANKAVGTCPSATSIPAQTTRAGCGTGIDDYRTLPIKQQKQVLALEFIRQS